MFSFFFRKNALLQQLHRDVINAKSKKERIRHMLCYSKGVTLKIWILKKINKKITWSPEISILEKNPFTNQSHPSILSLYSVIFTPKWTFHNGNVCCTRQENWKVLSSYFRKTPNLIFIPPFYRFSLPLVLFFPIAPGSRQETLAKKPLAGNKNKAYSWLTTVIRELINYELTFFSGRTTARYLRVQIGLTFSWRLM